MDALEMLKTANRMPEQAKSLQRELERVRGDILSEQMIRGELSECRERYRAVHMAIEGLSDAGERLLLRYRYLFGMTWRQITAEMRLSKSAVHRLHARALDSYLCVSGTLAGR